MFELKFDSKTRNLEAIVEGDTRDILLELIYSIKTLFNDLAYPDEFIKEIHKATFLQTLIDVMLDDKNSPDESLKIKTKLGI